MKFIFQKILIYNLHPLYLFSPVHGFINYFLIRKKSQRKTLCYLKSHAMIPTLHLPIEFHCPNCKYYLIIPLHICMWLNSSSKFISTKTSLLHITEFNSIYSWYINVAVAVIFQSIGDFSISGAMVWYISYIFKKVLNNFWTTEDW